MKRILTCTLIIFVIFTQSISAQVIIGQPQQQQQTQQVSNQQGQQQQSNQTQYTPEQIKRMMFEQYVQTFFPEATANWVGTHTMMDTIISPVSGYKIIRFSNGQPVATDYIIPKGSIVTRYRDQSTDEYYYLVSEDCFIVKNGRYEKVQKEMEKKEKQNKKDAKKLAKQNRTPEEKQMVMQRDVMIAQAGYNVFLQVFGMIQQNRMMKRVYGNSGYTNTNYYGSGPQTINW